MGTRGFIGFVVNDQEKIAYNHWDSYPSGLGVEILQWLHQADPAKIREQAANLKVVEHGVMPTDAEIVALRPWTNLSVGTQSTADWYCLLRETQGNPEQMLACGFIEDASEFPYDSLFAEWGYIVDFDNGKFEVYRGFQTMPHNEGRFAGRGKDERVAASPGEKTYKPCRLIATWSLDDLPTTEAFCEQLEG